MTEGQIHVTDWPDIQSQIENSLEEFPDIGEWQFPLVLDSIYWEEDGLGWIQKICNQVALDNPDLLFTLERSDSFNKDALHLRWLRKPQPNLNKEN